MDAMSFFVGTLTAAVAVLSLGLALGWRSIHQMMVELGRGAEIVNDLLHRIEAHRIAIRQLNKAAGITYDTAEENVVVRVDPTGAELPKKPGESLPPQAGMYL